MPNDDAATVHRELETALAAVREHDRVRARLTRAAAAEAEAQQAVAAARQGLADEQADVRALETFSPTRIWATLRGARDTELDRERAEQQVAEYAVARAESSAAVCRQEVVRAEAELAALGDVDGALDKAMAAKELWLRSVPGPAGERLVALADEVAGALAELTEVREAIAAGEAAAGALERVRRKLGAASDWATYDTFLGGGLITDAIKYNRMDEAQRLLHDADGALRHLSTELADVGVKAVVQGLSVDGLTQAFDVWFDNIFSDWAVRDRITQAARRTDGAAATVHEVRVRLAHRERDLTTRIDTLGGERAGLLTAP
ncbi:hypothetical protein H5V45_01690 [Nocardioides sp. KIGAM211]|uniref:Uncharacterized protein n=1 Tax=Nocardioides luti TaxID=2761101 RepID=A0A7X0V8Y1_9ACTN|nr:hypothetical protein [Nocardioides luti]MBB6626021.1 hypothetical protein [Nocardioides luti]